jgi:hypothetical protein
LCLSCAWVALSCAWVAPELRTATQLQLRPFYCKSCCNSYLRTIFWIVAGSRVFGDHFGSFWVNILKIWGSHFLSYVFFVCPLFSLSSFLCYFLGARAESNNHWTPLGWTEVEAARSAAQDLELVMHCLCSRIHGPSNSNKLVNLEIGERLTLNSMGPFWELSGSSSAISWKDTR